MTAKERTIKSESIIRRQNSGKITKEQASAEFDALLDDCGDLHYYSDTTMMREIWEGQAVMVMNGAGTERKPSDIGLITQGPLRGTFVNRPGTTGVESANMECLKHFGWTGPQ